MSNPENERRTVKPRFIEDDEAANVSVQSAEDSKTEPQEEPAPKQRQATEEFDYVMPATTYKQRHKKHHKKSHTNENKTVDPSGEDAVDEAMDGYVFAAHSKKHHHSKHHHSKRHHKKKKPLWLKILIIVGIVLLSLTIILTATFFILREIGRKGLHNYDDINISIPIKDKDGNDAADVIDKGRTIKYNGKTYRLNEDMIAITFIGFNENDVGESDNYMADAIYIIAIDDKTGKTTILGVSRDTMLDVNVYSAEGDFIDTEKIQLSYAYSYAGEGVTGGENVNTSLTRMLFGLPINNYFAIDLAALSDLNDAIGGVTLTSQIEFYSEEQARTIHKGERITLYGKDVERYVRARDRSKLDSNNERMDRQQQYIKAFLSSIVPAAKKDLSTVTNLYGVVKENADTTIDLPKVTYLASSVLSKMRSANDVNYARLNGKMKAGEHPEMYLDDKNVLETMLDIFYQPE